MMDAPLIRARYRGGAFVPALPRASLPDGLRDLREGETVVITVNRERSMASHRHQFAWVRDAWATLPEAVRDAPWAASPETLRKHALIATGFAHCQAVDCGSPAVAARVLPVLLAHAMAAHGYAIGAVRGQVLTITTAESQSVRAMGRERFKASKEAVLTWIAGVLDTSTEDLRKEVAA